MRHEADWDESLEIGSLHKFIYTMLSLFQIANRFVPLPSNFTFQLPYTIVFRTLDLKLSNIMYINI